MRPGRKPSESAPSSERARSPAPGLFQELLTEIQALRRELDTRSELASTQGQLDASTRRLAEVNAEIDRLRAQIRKRDEQLEIVQTRQAYHFARTLIEARTDLRQSWRVPVAFVKLVLPSRALQLAKGARSRVRAFRNARRYGTSSPPAQVVNEPWPAEKPLVSVVIPCFNYGRYLDDSLQSVYRQTLQDYEIILIEGGSTDPATVERVRAIAHPKVRKIFQPMPTKVGDNRLKGLLEARGKYIACLDADDMLEPTYLEKAVMALELTGVDIAYPSVRLFEREERIWETADEFTLENLAKLNTIATVAVFRHERWKRLGIGYGTHVRHAIEDWDFWLRFAERGARGYKIHEPLMLYRVHGNSLTDAARNEQGDEYKRVLAEHRPLLDAERIAWVSEQQRTLPTVKEPLANLSRIERDIATSLRIAVAVPWLAIGGSDFLLLQVFGDLARSDASLCVYTTLGALPSMGTSAPAYCKITDDVFELQKGLPLGAQPEAILHLLRSRRSNILMIVGSAATYQLLPRIRQEFPHLCIIDHLYNTVGHLSSNRRFAKLIDFHIVASEEVQRALLDAGEPPERVKVIHHGIDMDFHSPARVPWREEGFENLLLAPGQKLVLYAGRFSEEKGVLRFVEIAGRMRSEKELVFAMIGDGPQRPHVEEKLKDLGLRDRVRLLGFVADSRPYLRRADAVVIPSDIDGMPLVSLEALALGTPVVASAVGALPEVIVHGTNGALADPKNLDSFVRALRLGLELDSDRARLALTCRHSVVDRYSIEKLRNEYFELFRQLAGVSRHPES